jgi:four helix bundle protein
MAKGDDIEERLIDFGVRVLNLCASLPTTVAGKHVARQLVRSGTSPAPNYGEARGAESNRDFVHKLRICLKELNESRIWLKMIVRANMLPEARISDLLQECDQLCRIMNASIQTATKRLR